MAPEISVIICTYNRCNILRECINKIMTQSLKPEDYEVLIIDNKSTDGTREFIGNIRDNYDNLFYFYEENQGLSYARNRGIKESKSDIVLFLDDDALACHNFLETYLRKYDDYPHVDCIGGRVMPKITFNVKPWMKNFYNNYLVLGYNQGDEDKFLDNEHGPVGANISFRKRVFEKHGFFDVELGRTGKHYFANEEEKLLHAIKEKPGSCLYTPFAYVYHVANKDRVGRRYLLKRAYDKGISDARSGYYRHQILHSLGRPFHRKVLEIVYILFMQVRETFLFHGVVMSLVYKVAFLKEKLKNLKLRPLNISSALDYFLNTVLPKEHDTVIFPFKHKEKIRSFRDLYRGARCFIIGNGPSLNNVDLTTLKNEITFGVNGIFYKSDEIAGFAPTFYIVEDDHVISYNLKRINEYKCPYKFFPYKYRNVIRLNKKTILLPTDWGFYREHHPFYCKPRFSKNCEEVVYVGQSVTYISMQLAYYMGFEKVYLIGMDFTYSLPKSTIVEGVNYTSREYDPNHFHPDYFGKGKKWHEPKLDRVLMNYEFARKVYEESGRKIYNATDGGKLEAFERVDYETLFK